MAQLDVAIKAKAPEPVHIAADLLQIGNYEVKGGRPDYLMDTLTFKLLYARKRFSWELAYARGVMQYARFKMEIGFETVVAASYRDQVLTLELNQPPEFYRGFQGNVPKAGGGHQMEQTRWDKGECSDFTNGAASTFRYHTIQLNGTRLGNAIKKLRTLDSRMDALFQAGITSTELKTATFQQATPAAVTTTSTAQAAAAAPADTVMDAAETTATPATVPVTPVQVKRKADEMLTPAAITATASPTTITGLTTPVQTQTLTSPASAVATTTTTPAAATAQPTASSAPPKQKVKRPRKAKAPGEASCVCTAGCNSKRCNCLKNGEACADKCKCKNCSNPFKALVDAGIDVSSVRNDDCFKDNVGKIKDLAALLNKQVYVPCSCEKHVALKEVIGGYECDECGGEYEYSWCRDQVCENESRPRNHCTKCGCCVDYRDQHCERCNKCYFAGTMGSFKCPCRDRPPQIFGGGGRKRGLNMLQAMMLLGALGGGGFPSRMMEDDSDSDDYGLF